MSLNSCVEPEHDGGQEHSAAVEEANRTKTRRVSKSQRQIAEDAECHQESAGKALRRLEADGLLEVVSRRKDQTTVLLVVPDLNQLMLSSLSSALPSPAGKEIRAIRITAVTGLRLPDVVAPAQRHHKIVAQEATYCCHPDSP